MQSYLVHIQLCILLVSIHEAAEIRLHIKFMLMFPETKCIISREYHVVRKINTLIFKPQLY